MLKLPFVNDDHVLERTAQVGLKEFRANIRRFVKCGHEKIE